MLYLSALGLFFLVHWIPLNRRHRGRFVERFGEKRYRLLFRLTIISIVAMGVWGWSDFPNVYFYEPPLYLKQLHLLIMLPTILLWVVAEVPNNIKRKVRHPMLYGMLLWGVGHLLANGDLRSALLFTSFLAYTLWAIQVSNRRKERVAHPQRPFRYDIYVCSAAVLLYVLIARFHDVLFGMPVWPYFFA